MKNVHAELIRQYAEDWMETKTPYDRWQYKNRVTEKWVRMQDHPNWDSMVEYRRHVPRELFGVFIADCVTQVPANGTVYYIPSLETICGYDRRTWCGLDADLSNLERKLIYTDPDDAAKHAKVLLGFVKS